jgi:predicted transcriptional regulator
MRGLTGFFLGCSHKNTGSPFTTRESAVTGSGWEHVTKTYIVCLDCGKSFPYSWKKMKLLTKWDLRREKMDSTIPPAAGGFNRASSPLAREV